MLYEEDCGLGDECEKQNGNERKIERKRKTR
jgi:hypothetical protein